MSAVQTESHPRVPQFLERIARVSSIGEKAIERPRKIATVMPRRATCILYAPEPLVLRFQTPHEVSSRVDAITGAEFVQAHLCVADLYNWNHDRDIP